MAPGLSKVDSEISPRPTLENPFTISRKRTFGNNTNSEQRKLQNGGSNSLELCTVGPFQNQSQDVGRARKATKMARNTTPVHRLGYRSQTLEQVDTISASEIFREKQNSGIEDLTSSILTLVHLDYVKLKVSTEMQIRHEIESKIEVLEARLRVSELTISRLRAKLAESEQPQGTPPQDEGST